MRAAEAEDADGVREIAGYADSGDDDLADAFRTSLFVERRHPRHLATYLDSAERLFVLAPHFAFGAYEGAKDLLWPVRARGAYYGPFRIEYVVVMHTTHDPAAPYSWGQHVVRDLGNARMLTYNGHGVIADFNPCALGAMVAYLDDLQSRRVGRRGRSGHAVVEQVVDQRPQLGGGRLDAARVLAPVVVADRACRPASTSAKPATIVSGVRRSWRRRRRLAVGQRRRSRARRSGSGAGR